MACVLLTLVVCNGLEAWRLMRATACRGIRVTRYQAEEEDNLHAPDFELDHLDLEAEDGQGQLKVAEPSF